MASVYRPVVTEVRAGKRRRRRGRFYWVSYKDAAGNPTRRVLRLDNGQRITDKEVAETAKRRLMLRTQQEAAGLRDPFVEAAKIPIRKVLADFLRHLRRKGRPYKYLHRVAHDVQEVVGLVGIEKLGKLAPDAVDVALGKLADRGLAPKTVNAYRDCVHAMAEWAVKYARILASNPISAIPRREIAGDVRKIRRALTHKEMGRLLAICGPRRLVYLMAVFTGLRMGEMKALRWSECELDTEYPVLALRAVATKSRRQDVIPLRSDLTAVLRQARPQFIAPDTPVFKSIPKYETFINDCVRADIIQLDENGRQIPDDRGRTVDRHALRTTFISWLSAQKVAPRDAMSLARHTDIRLTMKNYTDPRLLDLRAGVESLPALTEDQPGQGTLQATGTDHLAVEGTSRFQESSTTGSTTPPHQPSSKRVLTGTYDARDAGSIPAASITVLALSPTDAPGAHRPGTPAVAVSIA